MAAEGDRVHVSGRGGLVSMFKGSGLGDLCGSHQEGAALWPVASLLRLLQSGHGSARVSLPSRTFQEPKFLLLLPVLRLLQTCFCGRKTSISNLLNTVTKQLLVYSNLLGGRDGEWRIGVSGPRLSGSSCSPALHAHCWGERPLPFGSGGNH